MDKTQAFRLALRRKGLGLGMAEAELLRLTSAAILKPIAGKSAFSKAAAQVAENIEEVKSFVRKHKREYTQQGIGCAADRIEQEVGLFVKACSARIEQLNKIVATELQEGRAVNHQKGNEQTMAHCLGVVLILSERLHDISIVFDQCRTQRYQKTLGLKTKRPRERAQQRSREETAGATSLHTTVGALTGESTLVVHTTGQPTQQMAMVEEENAALLEELGKLSQKAQGTEQMMQEIATLNQMFSDQILGQAAQIEQIYLDAVHASANVKTGNVHLTKAVALNTSTRKIVLALLVTASLLLLFYDWFNS